MGKLMVGTLLALSMLAFTVPNAGAAEIPPTAKCVKTSKGLFKKYFREFGAAKTDAAEDEADRKLATALFDAGCVSDVEPLLSPMEPKPFSSQCIAAAKSAGNFWNPKSRRFNLAFRSYKKRVKPLDRRINRLSNRIRKLRANEGPVARINRLSRVRKRVERREFRIARKFGRNIQRQILPYAFDTTLMLFDLISLRCLDENEDFIFEKQRGPVGRVVHRNGTLIFSSIFYLAIRYGAFGGDVSSSATSASLPSLLTGAEPREFRFPYIPTP